MSIKKQKWRVFQPHEKYFYRHELLKFLYDKISDQPIHVTDLSKSKTDLEDIAAYLNVNSKKLKEYHEGFHTFGPDNDHVKCSCTKGKFIIELDTTGIPAYLDEYWLREGQKSVNERIYDRTKWLVPLIAIVVTGALGYLSINNVIKQSRKTEVLRQEIQQLNSKVSIAFDSISAQNQRLNSISSGKKKDSLP